MIVFHNLRLQWSVSPELLKAMRIDFDYLAKRIFTEAKVFLALLGINSITSVLRFFAYPVSLLTNASVVLVPAAPSPETDGKPLS
jgi:hypothetical protein